MGKLLNSSQSEQIGNSQWPPPVLNVDSASDLPNQLLDFIPAAVYVCNADGTLQRYNRGAAELWGREPVLNDPGERFCGSARLYRLDGGPLPHDQCPMADVLRTGVPVRDQEVVIERPDGSRSIALVNINALRDVRGTIVGAVNSFFDITDRKQLEREQVSARKQVEDLAGTLVRERDQSRALIDALPTAVYTTDAEGCVTYFNDAAAAIWGRRPKLRASVFCGSWKLYYVDGTPMPRDACPMALSLAERQPIRNMEAIAERPDGSRIRFAAYPTPFFDDNGTLMGAVNMLVDVTERRRHEADIQAALQAKQELAAIVESSHDAIVSKNLEGIVRSWNKGAERMFGYTAGEMIGNPIMNLIPPDRQDEEPHILERIRRGEHIEHYETVRMHKDGSLIDISLTVSPVRNADGRIIGASKIARNITESKQAHARQELLAREVNHRTKNLFAVVHSIVKRSLSGKKTLDEAASELISRLHSLSQTHTMLMDKDWQGADLGEIIRVELSPYVDRITAHGPPIVLDAKAAQNFALALHELATNAAKYGALSNATGRVEVRWSSEEHDGSADFVFSWQEAGGPRVQPCKNRGFGSVVLEQVMAEYFEPPPRVEFAPGGVRYELRGPLELFTTQEPDQDQ